MVYRDLQRVEDAFLLQVGRRSLSKVIRYMRYKTGVAHIFDCTQMNDSSCEAVEFPILHKRVEESFGSSVVS